MPESRQPRRVAPATRRRLQTGERITTHFHDQAQLIYPAHGLLGVTTERGTWMAPPHRAVWVPAGAEHEHQAYGVTDMRALLFPTSVLGGPRGRERPAGPAEPLVLGGPRAEPTVITVSGLLRELIMTLTGAGT